MTGQYVLHGRAGALVGDMLHVESAGLQVEQFTGQMADVAGARTAEAEFAGTGLDQRGQFLEASGAHRRMYGDRQLLGRHQRHRRDVARHVERQVGNRQRRDGECCRTSEVERVAVRRRLDQIGGRDRRRCARLVFNHHRLAEDRADGRRQLARDHVGRPPGGEAYEHANRLVGVACLGDRRHRRKRRREHAAYQQRTQYRSFGTPG